ncbi:unnamed protein product [Eretmochelys imbricata]
MASVHAFLVCVSRQEGERVVTENCTSRCECLGNGIMTCSELSCGPDEICKIQNGLRGCYPAGSATCHIYGDPHYTTFDGKLHHFQGACNYTVVETCDNSSGSFRVTTRNEHRGSPSWTAINSVALTLDGVHIALRKNRMVYVNGKGEIIIPFAPSPGVQISSSGLYVMVSTDFGLTVKFDGNHRVEVTLPSSFKEKVCGMCGNYNGNAADDFLNPDGVLEPDSTSLGNSWQVSNHSSCPPGTGHDPVCDESDKQIIASSAFCGLLTDVNGPFKKCHGVLDPTIYFSSCVYDQCELQMDPDSLCKSLQSYADACRSRGAEIDAWRNATFCPIDCPRNSHYEACTAACPATCVNPMAPASCSLPCVEGCVCDSGYLLYNDGCVPSSQCGCWHNGKHYPVGSEFWTDDTCSSKCRCPSQGSKVTCSNAACPADHYCGVQNGKPGCYPETYGICRVHNDPHYNTFDRETHHFMGICTYTLAKVCANSSSLPYFNVEAKNEHRGKPTVSYVQKVLVEVYGQHIEILRNRPSQVLVNEVLMTLPVSAAGGSIRVSRSGRYVTLETDFRLRVSYDTDHSVEVKVPTTYFNRTCGMCGNFNGRRQDDYMMPDGQQAKNSNELGNSWRVMDDDPSCGGIPPPDPCPADRENLYRTDRFCGMITQRPGPFAVCHSVINPESIFESCVYDLCALNGSEELLCSALATYADACQEAGVTLPPWRNATFCAPTCSAPNSHYEPCMTACPATCLDRLAPENCSKPCVEGCACNSGFVLSGSACVPEAKCGCVFQDIYYSEGERVVTENCTSRCECLGNGIMTCSELSCGPDEICKIQNGLRGCYPAGSATCHIYGDPHYTTFDGKLHHFQGACNYTVVETCDNSSGSFRVTTRNEHRGSPSWTAINSVALTLDGVHIALRKNRMVYVNGKGEIIIPFAPSPGVQISSSGLYVMVSTDFGLTVKFDGNHRVEVTLPSSFKEKVCGMCGNYNGNAADDFLNPDGVLEPDSTSLGNSWQVSNHSSCPPGTGHDPVCDESDKQIIASSAFCGLLTDVNGPFKKCHGVLDPTIYFSSCVYDQCELQMDPDSLCKSLQSYADACRSRGAEIDAWRNATFCPIDCPRNSHYEACTAACPATCVNPMAPASCSLPCVEGCVCDSGYLLYNDGCVPSSQCGCWHNGKHYPVGSEFWTDDTCSSKCRCPSQGSKVTCSNAACPADHYCGVQNGKPGCYPETYGICRVHNDPHYNTFDRETHHFMGICTYTLAKVCANSSSLPYFNVEAKNEHRGKPTVSYVQKVLVEVYGQHIEILRNRPSQVLVNEVLMTLPVSAAGGSIRVSRSGRYVTLETDFRLRVSYDTDHSVEVKVPTTYFNRTCGMCGNFNGRRQDDYMMPDGQQAKNSNELGNSWRVMDDDPSCGGIPPPDPCPADRENLYRTDRFCGMITQRPGPFAVCHSVINPESIFESCVYDLCALNGSEELLCSALATYADACQEAGVTLPPWRNATFCAPTCSAPNSHYEPCMTACPATCLDRLAPENCSKPCVEGCACNSGFVLSGSACVPEAKCGCVFQDIYYSEGERVVTENCTSRCECLGNGIMTCSELSCGPDEICKIQNGLRGCYPAGSATCHIYGDPHYTTFDGKLHHFQGACNYTVVETCDNSSGSFRVTTRNEHRGSPSWTAINSVALTLDGVHIALRKNRMVYINGALASPPKTPLPGVTVSLIGRYVQITTTLGVQLQFNGDHELFVRVTEKYKGRLCGLCGTYTGTQQDDFTRPDGVVVADANEFGASWRVPDDEWPCDTTILPPVTCTPSEQLAAEERCGILTHRDGPFAPCRSAVPPHLYLESCVYDQCATGGSSEQLCNDLESYAAACAEAGVSLGEWTADTICAPCNMSCSFDTDFCDWTQSVSDSLDWKRHRGPTSSPNTGPSYDHTTGDGYFIYLQASEASSGAVAHLQSPVCSANGPHCFRFWYHMYGVARTMALRVYVAEGAAPRLVWSETGNKGDRWNLAEVTVYSGGNMQILLEGQRGEDFRSDVAVDDVSLINGYCPGDVPPTTVSTTSTTSTPSVGTTTPPPSPSSESCVVAGDPHYYTFDKQTHHFMGTCAYTLSKLCDGNSTLPYFNVEAANERRGGNTRVSYVQYVDVDVRDLRITLEKGGVVKVNGKGEIIIPFAPSPGVQISSSGLYVMVSTDFGLTVKFDGNHRVEVTLPSSFKEKVCGMCGNYNGNAADDFLNPDGVLEPDSTSLGNSWQVSNHSSCPPGTGHDPVCDESDKQIIASSAFCGLLTDVNGPFKKCHGVLDPTIYFSSCVYDQCELQMDPDSLCKSLQSYADACRSRGAEIDAWRNATFCPIDCPRNSHYEACTAACPATCVNPMAPASCSLPCVEGCVCDSGYLLYNDGCVPSSQCGCWHNGKHYPVGSEFWTDDTCSSKCRCPSQGSKVTCSNAACPADHYCGVQNGKPGCYPETYGICRVHNDPHYNTFDRETHHFMGICTYTLAKVCANSSSLPYFNVEAKNEHRGKPTVSYVQKVLVEVYGQHIEILRNRPSQVLVNEVLMTLPVSAAGGSIRVSRSGRYVTLETDFRLRVSYDTDHSVEVKVPTTYFNRTCGMCGNFNGRRQDDYMMPDGQQAKNSNELGNSWRVMDDDPSCGGIPPPDPCPADRENLYRTDRFCGMITQRPGPFAVCHSVINPESIFESCVYDLCALNGSEELLCSALATYADACQEAGVTLPPWRNATFCAPTCSAPNSHYEPCMTACPATCLDRLAPENCSKPCVEGCACNSGFVLSGSACVPEAKCGCVFQDIYYSEGERVVTENCTSRCECLGNGIMTCSELSCGPDEICKIQNGLRGCYPAGSATCHIYGDPHYTTFDGKLHHFQGACNYTVVETCDNSSGSFRVTTRNEHRGSPSWTAINSVALTLDGVHIALRKNRMVYINGALASPPKTPLPGVTVSLIGRYVQITTTLGVQLQFNGDHELFVRVTEKYKGRLCGLCGTYTGTQQDDFTRPDGVVVADANEFGASWRVPDDEWPCDTTILPPVTCTPSEQLAAEERCGILTHRDGPFAPCRSAVPPHLYLESCVYDQCATGGSSEQLCNDLESYAAACAEAGVSLGEWTADTICAPCNMSCSFDTDFCDWTQSVSDSLDWKRHRGPTSSPNTGPSYDHTTGDGYFIYLQASEASSGAVAHLQSPVCSANGPHCFRFWYHMYGVARTMALRVYVAEGAAPRLVWSETGNKGDRWNLAEVTVYSGGNMQILLEGQRGEDFRSDVAVDDVSLINGYCPGDVPPTTVSTTSTSSTPSVGTTTPPPSPSSESCVVAGDPHYYTFDKQTHHFMGTCAYTLSKLCDGNSTLPYFNVEAANERRGGNTRVSYVQYVDVDVRDLRITLEKGGVVKVNGKGEIIIPFAPSPGVQISSSGLYVMVSTDFGLTVKFDGNHRVEVTLPSSFKEKVCGMCGNYNGNAADDFLNPDGVLEPDSTSLGNSWQVSNHSSCPPGTGHDPVCDESDKQIIASSAFCGLLTDVNGPFKKCHGVLDPTIYFSSCVYDQCELQMDPDSLCKSLQSYADACRSRGAEIDAWRNATFCPIDCPRNSHYEACTAACPATCVNPMAPASCSLPCVEGCVCDSGYLLYNDGCVPSSQCGCWHNGKHYPVGSEFWTDDTCSSKCRCPSQGSKVTCSNAACPADHYCGVQNGKPGCYPETYGICRVHNDPHYNTFDRETHHFMGICTYTLAKVCANSSSLPYFNVEAKNEHRGKPTVSYVQKVLVEVYGQHIEILRNRPSQVLVNEVLMTLPVSAAGGSIRVSRSGRYVTLETDFRLRVSYDTDHSVEVKVPTTYFNRTCGMCGNFNGRRQDDYMMPDGQQAKNSNELGNSWRVMDDDPSCGGIPPPDPCPADRENLYRTDRFCGMITQRPGPFAVCHSVINPESIFESCVYDLCALNGSEELLCSALATYADACQEAGVTLPPWRNATFCAPTCSAPNSHYEPCMTACPATCLDRLAPENCSKPCVEGCACNSGFVLSGSACVPEAKCGCVFQDIYYSEGERVVTENCTSRCECLGNGIMTCSELSCGPDEICKIQNGLRGCYPAGSATCHIYGDPHYTTFDGKLHHFQGACNYTVVETCDNSSGSFRVTTRNEHRGSPSWTAINSVALTLDGVHIALRKNRMVYVNGKGEIIIPFAPSPGVQISSSGLYVMVSTDFGLTVKFDGNHRVEVTLPSSFKEKVCGMCGNYNGNAADDFLNPDGVLEPDSTSLGNSWQVSNHSSCPPGTGHDPVCDESDKQIIASSAFCGLLTDVNGPFKKCHGVLDPTIYFSSCVYDQCELQMDPDSLCKSLQSYADACRSRGAEIDAWRNATFCPIDCPRNSHYEACTAACPATCVNPMAPASCSLPCVEGCVCDSGYLLYNDGCVPSSQCGCWHNGKHYPVGSEFWTDDTCSSKCRCPSQGSKVTCSNAACPADHYCGVQNGKPGCYPETYGICRVHNDPHYNTFDRETHHFMGICTYTLAKVCANSSSLPYFNVEAKNEHRGKPTVSYVQKVLVEVYGQHIEILRNRPSQVLVNEVLMTLPVSAAGGSIRVSRSGRYVTLETDFRLRVSYDTDHSVEVKVPTTYFNRTCGMCGNFNGRRQDDYMMPDGQQAKNSNELGNSWRVMDDDPSCGGIPPPDPCPADRENLYRTDRFCGMITQRPGPFAVCHSVINPESIFESCVYDLCALNGSEELLCSALATYADACQEAGVTLPPWRNATFCAPTCSAPNSHYEPCMTACPATCLDRLAPENCSKPCVEGCACNSGFVLSGSACVPEAKCGCVFQDIYYSEGERVVTENCTSRCECLGNGIMTCSELSCGPDEICKIQNGLRGCYPAGSATCHIYGDPHYTTFDGKLHHFQGACNYTVVETCDNSSGSFRVTTRNEHRGSPSWTAINSVALTLDGVHIALRKNRMVYINGALASPPKTPLPGVTVSLIGRYVQITTTLGVQLQFNGDHELFVRVTEKYKGRLCGLCGTYTGTQQDDFTRPDGVVVADANEFGASWRVPDDEWPCDTTILPPVTCTPSEQLAAEERCGILTHRDGPFAPCRSAVPPHLYLESCVYDQCATGGSSEQLCNDLESYAAACAEAGVSLGEWTADTICAPCNMSCSFDTDFCDWTQSVSDSLDWKRHRGPTSSPNTGPSYDHTTGDGYFIYLQASEASSGAVAHLQSPVCSANGPHCFRFWYHMYGVARTMALRVYVAEGAAPRLVWSETGNKGDRWNLAEVTVYSGGNMQILLEGQRGEDFRSDVAVDDVSLINGYCPGDVPPTTVSTTSTSSTPSVGTTTPPPSPSSGKSPTTATPMTAEPCQTGRATCSASGDPHYYTFDGRVHHFMGNCTYTLSKVCNGSRGLPPFDVSTTNEHRGSNTKVSYVKSVHVDVYGTQISLLKNRKVTVNGTRRNLPVVIENKIKVQISGRYVLLETDFGLWVRFDGNHYVEVSVSGCYKGQLCGLCGNYNGDAKDDNLKPNGSIAGDSTELGESWLVAENNTICSPDQVLLCEPQLESEARKDTACGMITDPTGIFKDCHAKVAPEIFLENCVYDMCHTKEPTVSLCNGLQAYAESCTNAGICREWRNNTLCPISCPGGSQYKSCGSRCPSTCVTPSAFSPCSSLPVEGCFCNEGYVLSGDTCVPESSCGCVDGNNHYHQLGESWFTHDACTERCTCNSNNNITCTGWACGPLEICGVQDGELGCYPPVDASTTSSPTTVGTSPSESTTVQGTSPASETTPPHTISSTAEERKSPTTATPTTAEPCQTGRATCSASGDPHYYTFDGRVHHFMGNCTYTLSKVCNGSRGLPPFDVSTTNEHRGSNTKVSYVKSVHVDVYGTQISLLKNRKVTVNGTRRNLPVVIENKIKVQISGRYVLLETDFGLWVRFDGNHYVEVSVSGCYKGQLCGLCGNYNGDAKDDNLKPNGSIAGDSTELGESWLVAENNTICSPDQVLLCEPQLESEARKDTACGMITDPTAISCPGGSQYKSCGSRCPSTCVTPSAFSPCSSLPVEGCFCNEGYVLSGDTCVPESSCGCVDENNHYHQLGESWFTHDACTERCTCNSNNNITCTGWACGPLEICGVQDGELGCYPPVDASTTSSPTTVGTSPSESTTVQGTSPASETTLPHTISSTAEERKSPTTATPTTAEPCQTGRATCSASGDPHYYTFDGRVHHFMGNCTYTLSKVCNGSRGLPPFDVSTTNEHRGSNTKVSYVKSVHVDVYGTQISLLKNRKVTVNGTRRNLPVVIENKIKVQISGRYVLLETDFGLWVRFDGNHYVEVSVSGCYKGQLCGLCGNYNGDAKDDNLKPNGSIAGDSTELGESWLVAENNTICSPDQVLLCEPQLESEARKDTACGMITDLTGIFKDCHAKVAPEIFLENCVYDMCHTKEPTVSLCNGLQAYAESCTNAGICREWRNNTLCPISCPAGSQYKSCGSRCPSTCVTPSAFSPCSSLPVEGCFCNEGYVLSGDTCVPESSCGCVDENNHYHQLGESWFTHDACTERCTCNSNNNITCTGWACGPLEICGVQDGELGCYPPVDASTTSSPTTVGTSPSGKSPTTATPTTAEPCQTGNVGSSVLDKSPPHSHVG